MSAILERLRTEATLAENEGTKPILARSFRLAIAEIERLEKQCADLANVAMKNGQGLLIYESALERIKDLADSEAGEPLDEAIQIAGDALAFVIPDEPMFTHP